ncbi:MAG: Type 1 glutamine amidotransferase-like domain-containing protein [Candidatus Gottesmanbacteria bacterium]|nr:Type 1 glutamine amidotransferase-like domain-containing protein [Candidatus Gottesmanbacteria bacterium]
MKLFLTSSGITNKTLSDALLQLLGKPFVQSHITFIPTAANAKMGEKSWLVNDMYNIKQLGFPTFDITDIAIAPKEIWLPSFEKADILVFGGGNTTYLLECMEKSGVASVIKDLLKNKVYMGISAGSMAAAKTISISSENILDYEQTGELKSIHGLGLVDFEIRPHLNSDNFPKVRLPLLQKIASETGIPFYAIDDDTAVQVTDTNVSVVSEGEWKKFN